MIVIICIFIPLDVLKFLLILLRRRRKYTTSVVKLLNVKYLGILHAKASQFQRMQICGEIFKSHEVVKLNQTTIFWNSEEQSDIFKGIL